MVSVLKLGICVNKFLTLILVDHLRNFMILLLVLIRGRKEIVLKVIAVV